MHDLSVSLWDLRTIPLWSKWTKDLTLYCLNKIKEITILILQIFRKLIRDFLVNRHDMMGTVSKLYVSNNTWIYVYIKNLTKFQLQFQLQLPRVSAPMPTPTPGVSTPTPTPTPASLLNINSNSNSGDFNSNSNSGVGVGVEPNSNSNSGVDPNPDCGLVTPYSYIDRGQHGSGNQFDSTKPLLEPVLI